MDDILVGVDAAKELGLSKQRLYELASAGRMGQKVGSHWLFTRTELEAYKLSKKSKGGRPKEEAGPLAMEAQPA